MVIAFLAAVESATAKSSAMVHQVTRSTSKIAIDGRLDEPAWGTATQIELAFEVQPGENVTPPVHTICFITYDDNQVYFGFKAKDPDPSKIRARYSDRDRAWNDDWVGIVLDTFNDQRRAYELFSTSLGVQIDAINDDAGGNYDDSWNAIWSSAGNITEEGFEVEMAVPYNQIRFQKVDGKQVWGFDAIRSWPRDYRHHIGAFPRDRGANSYLSQTIKIEGMEGADPGSNLEVIPTLTANRTDLREELSDPDLVDGDTEVDVGASIRWGMTPSMSLNAAINPDFSQVEADVVQLDVNEQFALFFPETRPFFLEGADYFNTTLRLVHTRSIADPDAAGKITGKQGKNTFGFFTARDDITNLIIPGPEGSSGGSYAMENWSSVARYRRDFGGSSTVGATLTDRRGDGYENTVASADAVYRITDTDKILATVAGSQTTYNDMMVEDLDLSSADTSGVTALLNYQHSERGWWTEAELVYFGDGYRSDLGFRPQVGTRGFWLGGAKVWWGEPGDVLQRKAWGASIGQTNKNDGDLLDNEIKTWANANGPWDSNVWAEASLGKRAFDGKEFEVWELEAGFFARPTGNLSVELEVEGGDWIDFAEARPGNRLFAQPSATYTLGRHLNLSLGYIYARLNIDEGRLFSVHAPELRAIHQFNTKSFLRLIAQYRITNRDQDLYSDEVNDQAKSLLLQGLFSYKVNPQTAFYLGYNNNRFGDDEFKLTTTDQTWFTKIGYAWVK